MPHGIDVLATTQQQRLGNAARGLAPYQAGGHDASLVCHQHVAGLKIIDDVAKNLMLHRAVLAMEHQHATHVAGFCRSLGDQLVGKVVIKVIGTHARPPSLNRFGGAWAPPTASYDSALKHAGTGLRKRLQQSIIVRAGPRGRKASGNAIPYGRGARRANARGPAPPQRRRTGSRSSSAYTSPARGSDA